MRIKIDSDAGRKIIIRRFATVKRFLITHGVTNGSHSLHL
jgi:hypothetical protein